METAELLKKVRKIEIKTKGLSNQIFSGQYHSAFKGKGMSFSEVREYQYGDDIRSIDWNVTARLNSPYIKVFEEERELTVMLLIDVSGSNEFGTREKFKRELITEISAVLAFSAIQNNDKVGVILFSNKIEKFIAPKKGSSHILRIIRELINFNPEHTETDITEAIKYFTNVIKKRCTAFVISDFMDHNFDHSLQIANKKHDMIGIRITDKAEETLPDLGLVRFKDAESGKIKWIDTSNAEIQHQHQRFWLNHENYLQETFKKSGVDMAQIFTDQDYIKPLRSLFKKRENRA